MPVRDLIIEQGATFDLPVYWYDSEVKKAITGATKAFPAVITAAGHGLPTDAIPVWISGIQGMTSLNTVDSEGEPIIGVEGSVYGTKLTSDTFSVPIDTRTSPSYVAGGVLSYYAPKDISSYTARMQVRTLPDDTGIPLLDLTTENGGLTITGASGKVQISISDDDTTGATWLHGYYDLELEAPVTGKVTRLLEGQVTISREVTKVYV